MMRRRFRAMPSADELALLYARPHDHRRWADHVLRVDVTVALAQPLVQPHGTSADLSCGNAEIARRLQRGMAGVVLGDFAPGYEFQGPIEETIDRIAPVDLFICSETIEHLDDPDAVLRKIRAKTARLVLSTPDGETDNNNPEHVWGWDSEAVGRMLQVAGFSTITHTTLDTRPGGGVYCYQIWTCR